MSGASSALVRCDGIARTYGAGDSAVVAVHGANCVIRAGDRIAITGPSGSGKSTLLHLLAGLDEPSAGTLTWPALGDRRSLRPGAVAVVFQTSSLIPALDVTENVTLPLLLAGKGAGAAHAKANQALTELGLGDLGARLPEELSGGQAQRVAVARALAGQTRLLLADEPTGQLDQQSAAQVVEALLHAADQSGAGLVVTTHDPAVAARLGVTWEMTDGRLRVVEAAPC